MKAIVLFGLLTTVSAQSARDPGPPVDPIITKALTAYISGSQTVDIPSEWRELARLHILDTLASIVACRDLETASLGRNYSLSLSGIDASDATTYTAAIPRGATILGTKFKTSINDAVFASAMAGHGAEINDFIPSSYVQPGPAIVSAAFALAEVNGNTGDEVMRAVITGYELAGRLPRALGLRNMNTNNIASHGVGPLFGTAAAAASLLKISSEQIPYVLTYCTQTASSTWQWLLDVEHIEKSYVFAGLGARGGLHAAMMVKAGFRGLRDAMDNPKGWLKSKAFTNGDEQPNLLVDGLTASTELNVTGYKRYPSGGPAQPGVHGMLTLLPNITVADVVNVTISMPGDYLSFRNAQMPALNLRYLSSIILIDGKLDFFSAQDRNRFLNDDKVKALMKKVEVLSDPSQESPAGQPRAESARVVVEEENGKRHEIFVPYVVGKHTLTVSFISIYFLTAFRLSDTPNVIKRS